MRALFDKHSSDGIMNYDQFKEAFIEFTRTFPTNDNFYGELLYSLKGRIKFYEENNRPDNASTLQILLNDILNDQLLNFMNLDGH